MKTLRKLISELRFVSSEKQIKELPLVRYIFLQYHRYQVTDQQLCKAREEMKFLGDTYATYLESQRKFKEIQSSYHGKGERTVKETADMVGFKLPHDPKGKYAIRCCDVETSDIARVFGSTLGRAMCTALPEWSTSDVKPKSPVQHFHLRGLSEFHPWLTCADLPSVSVQELVGLGAVKAVYRAKWKGGEIAYNVLNNPAFINDFQHGLDMLKKLNPSPFIVQLLGYCAEENVILTEYHKFGNAKNITDIISANQHGSLLNRLKLCLNYAQILKYLHNSPIGTLVFCDSNDLMKLLTQLLVTDQLTLVLNDIDALPQVNEEDRFAIKCGHKQISSKFVAPEQLWMFDEPYDDLKMPGYDEKSDIWKSAAVCNHFLGDTAKTNIIAQYNIFALHEKCKSQAPYDRPSANDLVQEYMSIIDLLNE